MLTAGGRWYFRLTLLSGAGMVAPLVWILERKRHAHPTGDAVYFHGQATLIANGTGWFIDPLAVFHHAVLPSAQHPPLWVLVLALTDFLGTKSYFAQLLCACLIGAGAVFMTGLAAREVGNARVGLIAAGIAAVYPNFWMNDGTGLAETLVVLLVAAVVFASYRFWRRPSLARAMFLGALCALAALTRSEQLLLIVVVLVPLALVIRSQPLRRRLGYVAVGVASALILIAPWVGFNLSRFSEPVFIADDLGSTLAFANCRPAYYHENVLGYGEFSCLNSIKRVPGDESAQNAHAQQVALHYVRTHLSRLPLVLTARVGRELGFFAPLTQLHLDSYFDRRPLVPAQIGLGMYYGLLVGGVAGCLVLRRRSITLIPMAGLLIEVVAAAMLTLGGTRYRAPLDVGLVVLTAVTIDALITQGRLFPKEKERSTEQPREATEIGVGAS